MTITPLIYINVTKCEKYQCVISESYLLGVLLVVYGFLSLLSDPVLVKWEVLLCTTDWLGDDVSREMESSRLNNLWTDVRYNNMIHS